MLAAGSILVLALIAVAGIGPGTPSTSTAKGVARVMTGPSTKLP